MTEPFSPPLFMAIINITPDSFSDGGKNTEIHTIFANIDHAITEGATIIDVGAESTRPGATPISEAEELERLRRFLTEFQRRSFPTNIRFSIDTYKSAVAEAALDAGFHMVNDVYGAERDPNILSVCAKYGADYIYGHALATPDANIDIITELVDFFNRAKAKAARAGIEPEKLYLDPGLGFGKTFEQNLEILRRLQEIRVKTGSKQIMIGASRKSFIGKITDVENPKDRLIGSVAFGIIAAQNGAHILRVHDTEAHRQGLALLRYL